MFAPTGAIRADSDDHVFRTLSRTFSAQEPHSKERYDEKDDEPISKAEGWHLMLTVQSIRANKATSEQGLGVTTNLTVKGQSAGAHAAYRAT